MLAPSLAPTRLGATLTRRPHRRVWAGISSSCFSSYAGRADRRLVSLPPKGDYSGHTAMDKFAEMQKHRERYAEHETPEAEATHRAIVSGQLEAAEHLTSCVAKDDLPNIVLETRVTLDAEYQRLFRLSRSQRERVLQQEDKQLARHVLIYFMSAPDRLTELVHLCKADATFGFQLCYFAVHERLAAIMEKFLLSDLQPVAPTLEELEIITMRNTLFRSLLNAELAHVTDNKADIPIRRLHDMFGKRNALMDSGKAPHVSRFSLAPACAILAAHLLSGKFDKTDSAPWDEFQGFYRKYLGHRANDPGPNFRIAYHFNLAGMSVQHPHRPRYDLMLKFLRNNLSSTTDEDIRALREFVPSTDQALQDIFSTTARLAEKDGHIEVAAWIKDLTPGFMNSTQQFDFKATYQSGWLAGSAF